jgi:hypothetical protein
MPGGGGYSFDQEAAQKIFENLFGGGLGGGLGGMGGGFGGGGGGGPRVRMFRGGDGGGGGGFGGLGARRCSNRCARRHCLWRQQSRRPRPLRSSLLQT